MKLLKNRVIGICLAFVALCGFAILSQQPAAAAMSMAPQTLGWNSGTYNLKYVALGDSVAAGLGYDVGIIGDENHTCGRSPEAYAYHLADKINARLGNAIFVSPKLVACQGATTKNLLEVQNIGGLSVRPQLDQAFEGSRPALLTMTAGANDVQWASFIGACFAPTSCNTPENDAALQAYINTMTTDTKAAMQSIKTRSSFFPPLVIASGYYTPVSTQCINLNFTADEVVWVQQATTKLNNTIREATQGSYWFARFAPVSFDGHDICSADSWIQRPGEQAPFHPTPRGQEEIANAILSSIGL